MADKTNARGNVMDNLRLLLTIVIFKLKVFLPGQVMWLPRPIVPSEPLGII